MTAAEVDKEVMAVLKESYKEAKRLLSAHRESLDKIADFLIEKETITGKEFMKIFHEVEGDNLVIEGDGQKTLESTNSQEKVELSKDKVKSDEEADLGNSKDHFFDKA